MTFVRNHPTRPHCLTASRRGFTIVEILFAIMILGVGFIMIAAMFPVAIQQGQLNLDESTAAGIAIGAQQSIIATDPSGAMLGDTAGQVAVASITNLQASRISLSNPRYAWAAAWQRTGVAPAPSTLWVWVAACRNRSAYAAVDLANDLTLYTVQVQFTDRAGTNPDRILFSTSDAGALLAAENAYVVVSNNPTGVAANGATYRLGSPTPNANEWFLQPGQDLQTGPKPKLDTLDVPVLMLGRGSSDNTKRVTVGPPAVAADGPAQDVMLFKLSGN